MTPRADIDTYRPLRDTWIFWCAIALHLIWSALLVWTGEPIGSTPLATLMKLGPYGAAVVLAISAGLVAWSLVRRGFWWCFIPQHLILVLSATDAAWAVLRRQYADGVPRSLEFIFSDQAMTLLFAVCYTIAVVEHTVWLYRAQFRTWPQFVVGAHMLVYACLLAVATVAYSAETRISGREVERLSDTRLSDLSELDRYRIAQLEKQLELASGERRWILGLLLTNLVALLASMITFVVKSKFDDREKEP